MVFYKQISLKERDVWQKNFPNKIKFSRLSHGVYPFLCSRGRGGVLPYISYIGMYRPIGVGFMRRFGLKTGIHFAHFGLESGMVFEGTTESSNIFYRGMDFRGLV